MIGAFYVYDTKQARGGGGGDPPGVTLQRMLLKGL